jgi:hypothetical protein
MTNEQIKTSHVRRAEQRSIFEACIMLLAVVAFFGVERDAHAVVPQSERDVLISIYIATNGGQWTENTNWCDGLCPAAGTPKFNRHGTECTWAGISCYADGRNVLEIGGLSGMSGTLPPLRGLTQLMFVRLPHNNIGGSVPDVAGMAVISDIDLSFNQLTGPVPDFSGLTTLGSINLSGNQLSGTIAQLHDLPQLETYRVSNNQLTGQLPTFAGLYFLSFIAADNNEFSGPVPDLSMTNVDMLYVDHNRLTGALPPPSGLIAIGRHSARLCPNPLDLEPGPYDAEWDVATATTPWWGPPGQGCDLIFAGTFEG